MNDEQLLRYSRQIMLPQIDVNGQERLLESSALIVGMGGLGSPVAMYLASAGIGHLILADFDDVELALGEMCNTVKNAYRYKGFIAGQVFKYAGFISNEGSIGTTANEDDHIVIVTYWKTFAQHEKSHADARFAEKFAVLAEMCTETKELGYELLWQGDTKNNT